MPFCVYFAPVRSIPVGLHKGEFFQWLYAEVRKKKNTNVTAQGHRVGVKYFTRISIRVEKFFNLHAASVFPLPAVTRNSLRALREWSKGNFKRDIFEGKCIARGNKRCFQANR